MKLSTRSRYGTRLILELALKYEDGPVYLKNISMSQDLSLKYLSQLIIPLKTAGIVKAVRGAYGGYYLTRKPGDIRLSEIVEALEGPVFIVDCIKNPSSCKRFKDCASRYYWEKINNNFYESMSSITIKDILDRHYFLKD